MTAHTSYAPAPELVVSHWFNTPDPPTLAALRGQVVVIEAAFGHDLTVLGLHTVFEHHEAMMPVSLAAFLYEYRITFPVGVDTAQDSTNIPASMERYQLQGTPSLLVIDRAGRLRINAFGQADDLKLGAAIARILDEPVPEP